MEQIYICKKGQVGGNCLKDGEGISQRTYMNNPWIQTTVWLWPEERGSGAWKEGAKGWDGDICNSVNNKNKEK